MSGASQVRGAQCGSESQAQKDYCIMYHGTTLKAARRIQRSGFIPSVDGSLGPGVYVSRNFKKAVCYPVTGKRAQRLAVLKLQVHVGKVKEIHTIDHPMRRSWHQAGYDAAWIPANTTSGFEEHCIWDPTQITVLNIITADHNNCFIEPPKVWVFTDYAESTNQSYFAFLLISFFLLLFL